MGYSTTAIGWLRKAHKPAPNEHPQLTLSKTRLQKQLVDLLIDNYHLLNSQCFTGSTNVIPDILSRYCSLDDCEILNLLTHLFSTQYHPYFRLSQVPSVINSFLWLLLPSLYKPTQMLMKPKPSGFALRKNCVSSYDQSALGEMYFWTDSAVGRDNSSWLPFQKMPDKPHFQGPKKRLVAETVRDTAVYLS